MFIPAASAFLDALGWALANSLWQFAICWLLYGIITSLSGKLTATVKHSIALLALFSGTVFFIIEIFWKCYSGFALPGVTLTYPAVTVTALPSGWQSAGIYIDRFMPYWSLLYLICIVLLFIKLCFFVRRAGSLRHTGITKLDAAWRIYIKKIAGQLGIQREVKAFLSAHIDTPQVIGFLKPVVLIPAACLTNLSTGQLEAVLLHELAHIKRNDYLVNLFIASVEILFFFNPFVKQLAAGLRKEREYSCDDMVLQFQYQPRHYAAALLTLEKNRLIPVTYGIAASGKNQKQLLTRIERLVGIKNKQSGFYPGMACLLALLLLGFAARIQPAATAGENTIAPGNTITRIQYNNEGQTHFIYLTPLVAGSAKKIIPKKMPAHGAAPEKINKLLNESDYQPDDGIFSDANESEANHLLNASSKESIDFSLLQKKPADVPETPDPVEAAEEPYVPASNFSFQFIQDTAMPRIKGETYNERISREAVIKARKAVAEINWKKLEKNIKYSQHDLVKLKKELTLQLQQVNWQKINIEVQNELGQQQLQKLQKAVKQDQVIKQYQQHEEYYEALQKQLTQQEQIIKASDQHLQDARKAAEEQQKRLQQDMKKRRIIYI